MGVSIFMVLFMFLLSYWSVRGSCSMIIDRLTTKSTRRKRRKNMTFVEWFTYRRYRLEVPWIHIFLSYCVVILYALLLVGVIILHLIELEPTYILYVYRGIFWFTFISQFCYEVIFFGFHLPSTWKRHPEKIQIRGVDKKEYMKKRRKILNHNSDEQNSLKG